MLANTADIWFLGMEEANSGEANIRTQLQFEPVMDNAEVHKLVGVTHLLWGRRKIQRTWRGMCHIMLKLVGLEPTRENIRRYQVEKLCQTDDNTMLTELMPVPKLKAEHWGEKELNPRSDRENNTTRSLSH